MSILDSVKRFIRRLLSNEVEKEAKKETTRIVEEKMKLADIPTEYSEFPHFKGNCVYATNKKTDKYIRFTMDFNHVKPAELSAYEEAMDFSGFKKATDVRYEYKNQYIIYEPEADTLHLVFHIKK